jgi:hypothetical protein
VGGRATELAAEQGVPNADFRVMDALNMTFPVRQTFCHSPDSWSGS